MDFLTLAPGYRRALALRRLTAALLLLAAALTTVTGRAANDPAVLAFTREVSPGEPLSADDVELQRMPEAIVPDGAFDQVSDVEGQIVGVDGKCGRSSHSDAVAGARSRLSARARRPCRLHDGARQAC